MSDNYEQVKVHYQCAINTKPDFYFNENGVSAYSKLVPIDYHNANVIHFVNDLENDFGIFTSKEIALETAKSIVKMTNKKRNELHVLKLYYKQFLP